MKKRILAMTLAAAMVAAPMTCMAEEATSTLPLSEEQVELNIARMYYPGIRPATNDLWIWQDFTEKSNIKVNWEDLPITTAGETLNLKLSTGDLPDAFYQCGPNIMQLVEMGEAGQFLPLEDLIEEHAPNLKKLFEEHPDFRKACVMPDGHIYSLPYIQADYNDTSVRWYVHKPTLDELGLEAPKTLEEFNNYLYKFKELRPDSYPLVMPDEAGAMFQTLLGAYGLGTTGIQGVSQWIDKGEDGNVRFIYTDDRYKEMLQQCAQWYKDGIIHPEQFSKIELAKWQNMADNDLVGAFAWVVPEYIGNEAAKEFIGVTQIEGPHGDKNVSWIDSNVRGILSFTMPSTNEHPVETIKWVDYWYGEEGYMYGAIGEEGVTYNKEGDKYVWAPHVQEKVDELGKQVGPFQFCETWYGGWEPQYYGMPVSEENNQKLYDLGYFLPAEEKFRIDGDDILNYLPEEIWTAFIPTVDEASELTDYTTDMGTYINEMQAKFISGAVDLEAGWEEYKETLNSMGLERYLEIKQAQYDRYKNA